MSKVRIVSRKPIIWILQLVWLSHYCYYSLKYRYIFQVRKQLLVVSHRFSPSLIFKEEEEENSSCSIPCLLITYAQQPEILVIALISPKSTTLQLVFFLLLQYKVLQLFCLLLLSTKTTPLEMKEKHTNFSCNR